MKFRFYDRGTYDVKFALTPDKSNGSSSQYLPKDMEFMIKRGDLNPYKEFQVDLPGLPSFLTIIIEHRGKVEVHDFE